MNLLSHPAVILFAVQVAAVVSSSLIGLSLYSVGTAHSVFIGGMVAIAPQSFFGFWVFRRRGAQNASLIVRNMFLGEGLKLVTTGLLFAWIWSSVDYLVPSATLAGFVLTVLIGQLSLPLMLGGIKTR